jgi:hypothetical protein
MARTLGVLAFVVGLAAVAQAQGKDAKAAAPQAPAMTAEGKKFLAGWIGQWAASDATMTMGDQKLQGALKMGCESVSAGWGTLCKGTFDIKGMPPSAATFLMGWDIATGQGHMFEVADTGEVHDHSGKWTSDKAIALVRQGRNLEGKLEKDACTATWASAAELKLECTGTVAGATAWTFSATNRK